MATYFINFYPKGVTGDSYPESYAYDTPTEPDNFRAIQIKVDIPDGPTVEVVK